MSDVFTKRQPMIDFGNGCPCPPRFTDQKVGDLLAELLSIVSDKGEPHKASFESKTQPSAMASRDAAESGEWKQSHAQVQLAFGDFAAIETGPVGTRQPKAAAIVPGAEDSTDEDKRPNPSAPFIGGDFAAIEAGLLGALEELSTATVSETGTSKAFPSPNVRQEGRLYKENQPAPRQGRIAGRQKRARRSRRVSVVIALVGMAGTGAIFGLNRWYSEPGIASIRADNGSNERQTEATSGTDAPAKDAPILSKLPQPSPRVLVNGNEQTFDVQQSEEKTLSADFQAQLDDRAAAAPTVLKQAPMPAEPVGTAAPAESNTVKGDLVPADGALLPSGAPPQANINEAPPASQSPAATEAPAAKAPEPVAKPQKPVAAKHRTHHGQPRRIANNAKPTRSSPLRTEPTPSTGPEAQSATMHPSPATDGPLGFLQNAVNSLTSTTAKLFEGTN